MEIHGTCKPGFSAVRDAFEANFAGGLEIGAAAAVTAAGAGSDTTRHPSGLAPCV